MIRINLFLQLKILLYLRKEKGQESDEEGLEKGATLVMIVGWRGSSEGGSFDYDRDYIPE